MLPRLARRLPADDARFIDPTWGGLRVLAGAYGARVRLLVEGVDVAERFPDTRDVASLAGPARYRPRRGDSSCRRRAAWALGRALRGHRGPIRPATLVISDLLWVAGRPLLAELLERRRDRLAGLAIAAPIAALAPAAGADAVLEVVALHGLLGVVAKRADSPYLPGVRSRLWTLVRVADAMAAVSLVPEPDEQPNSRPDIALLRTLPLGEDA